jgi:uncharacterized protein (TIGR03382 family)
LHDARCSLRPSRSSLHRTLLALLAAAPLCAQATTVHVASSSEKLRPTDAPRSLAAATLSAARNEFEAFQIVVEGAADQVSATAEPFTGPATLPAPRLFREALIDLASPSSLDGATGRFPDALVPDVDEVVGEKRNAFPFSVPPGENRVLWVELHVPPDAPAGVYQGGVTVHASTGDVRVPVTLTVWDFALPSTSSLRSHFGLYYGDLIAAHGVSGDALSALRARYGQLALDHRITLGSVDDGNRDLGHYAQFYGPLMDGTAPTQLGGARMTSAIYTGSGTQADYAAWASFFRSRGWFDRLIAYTCDEPPATCAWSDIPARNATAKAGDPGIKTLVTTSLEGATAQGVLSAIDIIVPNVDALYAHAGATYARYPSFVATTSLKELWQYQSCDSHGCGWLDPAGVGWPSYMIDAGSVRARAEEWLSFQAGATGELYWETTWAYSGDAWSNQNAFNGNGDGTLFYPGTKARIGGSSDIPLASIRLKMIREGMEDFEYLKALSDAGDPALAHAIAAQLFPDGLTEPSAADLLAARETIARRVVELRAGSPVPPGTSPGASLGATAPGSGAPAGAKEVITGGCTAAAGAASPAALAILALLALRRRRRA